MKKMRNPILFILLFPLFMLSGCSKWLDVSPENQITDEDLYKDYNGFRNALNGVYRELSEQGLYGRELSWGFLSVLAQDYDVDRLYNAYPEAAAYNYDFEDNKAIIETIWTRMYNAVANCNKLIEEVKRKESSFFPLGAAEQDLIHGEALALRAFIHFDIARLFAPSLSVDANGAYVPYFTHYPSKYEVKRPTSEILTLVVEDLVEAEKLVAHFDTTYAEESELYSAAYRYHPSDGTLGRFFESRGIRLNYMAIHGLLARVYMYAGDEENAEKEARFVLEHFVADEGGVDALRFATEEELRWGRNFEWRYMSEILFALYDRQLTDLYDQYKVTTGTSFALKEAWPNYFTQDGEDIRVDVGELVAETGLYNVRKWQEVDNPAQSMVSDNFALIPILRLSEMYYIISECRYNAGDEAGAIDYLQKVRDAYHADGRTIVGSQYWNELLLEMQKEYLTEGQLFYYYKRRNIPITNGGMTITVGDKFVFPIPESEDVF